MGKPYALERAPIRAELIRLIALGEFSQTQLAERFGVTQQAISDFASRHAPAIRRQKESAEDRFAGILYADKIARVAELSEQVEFVVDILDDPDRAAKAGVQMAEMLRTVQSALRNIAEEKGELPSRQTIQHEGGVSVRYVIEGVDTGDLS